MPELHYQRTPPERNRGRVTYLLRIKLQDMTNHELRCVLMALWRSLDEDAREDHLREIQHHRDRPESELPSLSQQILTSLRKRKE